MHRSLNLGSSDFLYPKVGQLHPITTDCLSPSTIIEIVGHDTARSVAGSQDYLEG